MFEDLYEVINEKYGPQAAESFVHFAEQDETILRKLTQNFATGLEFCLKVLGIALAERK